MKPTFTYYDTETFGILYLIRDADTGTVVDVTGYTVSFQLETLAGVVAVSSGNFTTRVHQLCTGLVTVEKASISTSDVTAEQMYQTRLTITSGSSVVYEQVDRFVLRVVAPRRVPTHCHHDGETYQHHFVFRDEHGEQVDVTGGGYAEAWTFTYSILDEAGTSVVSAFTETASNTNELDVTRSTITTGDGLTQETGYIWQRLDQIPFGVGSILSTVTDSQIEQGRFILH